MLLTQEKQWRRDSNALSLSFVVSFFTQRTPQTKTNIMETTDGFTDGTKSKSRWDFEEFKGFIFFNSIWTVVFYSHPKTDFWGEVARIKWSFEIGPKRHECFILYCYSWRVAAIAVDLPHSYLLALHQNVLKASCSEIDLLESIRHVFFQGQVCIWNKCARYDFSRKFLFAL